MFNRRKIEHLEWQIIDLERERERHQKKIWELRDDLRRLTDHFGLKFEDVNVRQIVKVATCEKFKE